MFVSNLGTVISQLYNRLQTPQYQKCSVHAEAMDMICPYCEKIVLCNKCVENHQCAAKKKYLSEHKENKIDTAKSNYSLFCANHKQQCIKIITQAKNSLNTKLSRVHPQQIQLEASDAKNGNLYHFSLSELQNMTLKAVLETQSKYKKQIQRDMQKIQKDIKSLHDQLQKDISEHIGKLNKNLSLEERIDFKNKIIYLYEQYEQLSTSLIEDYVYDIKHETVKKMFRKIHKALSQVYHTEELKLANTTSTLELDAINLKTGKTPKGSNTVNIKQAFKKSQNSTPISSSDASIQTNKQEQPQRQSNNQFLFDRANINSKMFTAEQQQRIKSMEKIIRKDLQTISSYQGQIKSLQTALYTQQQKNLELSRRLCKYKSELQENQIKRKQLSQALQKSFVQDDILKQTNIKKSTSTAMLQMQGSKTPRNINTEQKIYSGRKSEAMVRNDFNREINQLQKSSTTRMEKKIDKTEGEFGKKDKLLKRTTAGRKN